MTRLVLTPYRRQPVTLEGGGSHWLERRAFTKLVHCRSQFFDDETGEQYWISGCKNDALYSMIVEIDEDARVRIWLNIRNKPELTHVSSFKGVGK